MTIHPPDAVVAARSFPRRWRALFALAAGDDERLDVLQRSGALELAREAAEILRATADRVDGYRVSEPLGRGEALDMIDQRAESLALAIDQVSPDDWTPERRAAMSSGIDEVAALLRKAEAAIEAARADRAG